MITIKEAITKSELTDFVKFPFYFFTIIKNWVSSLIDEEVEGFVETKYPVF